MREGGGRRDGDSCRQRHETTPPFHVVMDGLWPMTSVLLHMYPCAAAVASPTERKAKWHNCGLGNPFLWGDRRSAHLGIPVRRRKTCVVHLRQFYCPPSSIPSCSSGSQSHDTVTHLLSLSPFLFFENPSLLDKVAQCTAEQHRQRSTLDDTMVRQH